MIVSYGRDIFVITRGFRRLGAAGQSVRAQSHIQQKKTISGKTRSTGTCTYSDGAGTAGRALNCFTYLLNAQEPVDVFASGYGGKDDGGVESSPGGTDVGPRSTLHPSSICLRLS